MSFNDSEDEAGYEAFRIPMCLLLQVEKDSSSVC